MDGSVNKRRVLGVCQIGETGQETLEEPEQQKIPETSWVYFPASVFRDISLSFIFTEKKIYFTF